MNMVPRYKIENDDGRIPVPLELAVYIGREANWALWPVPQGAFVPRNVWAERMVAYFTQIGGAGAVPPAPLRDDDGEIFLPSFNADPIAVDEAPQGAPLYHYSGRTVALLAWPTSEHEPANDAALTVIEYLAANADNHRLAISPWCEMRRGLCLPKLPAVRVRPASDPREALHQQELARSRSVDRIFERMTNGARRPVSA